MKANDPNEIPIVFSYSRAQAIADGVLVDLTEWARETGFTVPVVCTSAVWHGYIVPKDELRHVGQSERGRGRTTCYGCCTWPSASTRPAPIASSSRSTS